MKKPLLAENKRPILAVLLVIVGLLVNFLGPVLVSYHFMDILMRIQLDRYDSAWEQMLINSLFPITGYLIILVGLVVLSSDWLKDIVTNLGSVAPSAYLKAELEQARQRAEAEPQNVKLAWDMAQIKLQIYVDRNLDQMDRIFKLSLIVMCAGFGVIVLGAFQENLVNPAIIGGAITEFIGATFILIYRSTIQLAANYGDMLERINTVGMAMQILSTISNETLCPAGRPKG